MMKKPSLIAFYLPQFHATPENDRWWGKGFTEWTAARGAKSLFEGHKQPIVPLGKRYYNLLEKETMQWQADLAKKYGIDGFSFYHYWFKDGRQVLEKPAENLLRWKEIDMPFCFNWANESWARTWSAIAHASPWADQYETDEQDDDSGMLMEQKYGNESAWQEHIRYLFPFFQDARYIRMDGRPVFMIYHPETVYCLSDMISCWNAYLRDHGDKEVYLITGVHDSAVPFAGLKSACDAYYMADPAPLWQYLPSKILAGGIRYHDAAVYWDAFFRLEAPKDRNGKHIYASVMNGYDDTPRRGDAGVVVPKLSPNDFQEQMRKTVRMAANQGHPFLFYNAWNEWGEGMILEPDEEYAYAYLEAIRQVMREEEMFEGEASDAAEEDPRLSTVSYEAVRSTEEARTLCRWLEIRDAGKRVADYLIAQNVRNIAIYGYGDLGIRLKKELQGSAVTVDYIIDRSVSARDVDCPTYQLSEQLPSVDLIVVTVHGLYAEIWEDIRRYVGYPISSLAHILFEIDG